MPYLRLPVDHKKTIRLLLTECSRLVHDCGMYDASPCTATIYRQCCRSGADIGKSTVDACGDVHWTCIASSPLS